MRPRSEQHDHAGNNGRSGINKEEEAEGNVGEDAAEGGPEAHSQIDGQPVQGERRFALRSRSCIGNDGETRGRTDSFSTPQRKVMTRIEAKLRASG